ncbi:DUF4834 family protein [Flavobacteriaceae bacterium]|nr:DUF4834 family protein [Flavobacteriaceae bacterium]
MIYTADLVGLFRTLLIFFLIYYIFKFLAKYIFPIVLKNYVKKVQREQQRRQEGPNVNVGETVVDKKPQDQKKSNDNVGEYVDFEEIE